MNLDRNIVIEASAGTGKTYTLVQTILQALFQKNLPMEALVALTFTKKAAGEMKERIAAELQKIDRSAAMEESWREWGQPLQELKERARRALETIDRAAIGTIHSYAFSLIKRFPLSAGISPEASVDEKGVRGDDLFEERWPKWLRGQLSGRTSAASQKEWLEVLERIPLSGVGDLARRLCEFDIPLEALPVSDQKLNDSLDPFYKEAQALAAGKPAEVKSTRIASACEEVLGIAMKTENKAELTAPVDTREALEESPGETKDWPPEEIRRLKVLRGVALNLLAHGDRTIALLTRLLKPFIADFRAHLLAEGHLSNDALLVLARELVAKDLKVRAALKHQIRLIFIDEFQDTDPLQGELLLFLAEVRGAEAKRWQDVHLEPGKLFIVGDPKQSIYLFRGADIGAYGRITAMVLEQGGIRRNLDESYRSHDQIIHAVNAVFSSLIKENPPISPPYQPLQPRRMREDPERHLVEVRLVSSQDPQSSDDALIKEAEDAADWIRSNVGTLDLGPWTLDALHYKDIALIFRSTPAMTPFIEKLRARNIPFVVEGERYFYKTPEVTDVLNLLRVLEDPKNRIALAGFLRSPLGGFNDAELALLQMKNGIRLNRPLPPELDSPAHRGAWELLRRLRSRVGRDPLKNILNHVYDDSFLLELAARSYHRDQTIANLFKLKRLMEAFAEEGETTLHGLLGKIDRFMQDDRLEGESPLADETYDAVRLLTIHKAKGLEFPVVWLPGLHRSGGGDRDTRKVTVRYDWSTGRLGVAVGRRARNIDDFILEREILAREQAEEARVLYVAMTRARDHLILSGGVCSTGRFKQPAKGSFLDQLAGAWGFDLSEVQEGEIPIGEGVMTLRRGPKSTGADVVVPSPGAAWLDAVNLQQAATKWKEREADRDQASKMKLMITPTDQEGKESAGYVERERQPVEGEPRAPGRSSRSAAALLGTLVHRFLERWDFSCEKCSMPAQLRVAANHYFAGLGLLRTPFPDPKTTSPEFTPEDPMHALSEIVEEAQRILADFIGSEAYDEIKSSKILGRELPFFYPTPSGALMRGTIDILYRLPGGALIVGDYKTDRTPDNARYAGQGKAYIEAILSAVKEKAAFKPIYLRFPAVPSQSAS